MAKSRNKPASVAAPNAAAAAWPFPIERHGEISTSEDAEAEHARPAPEGPAERIRVEQISLYTDPAKNVVERIALDALQESPHNPRTRYDQKALEALAETIRGVGVMQPLLVRPLSVDGLLAFNREHRGDDTERPTHEIIYGHRRYRAARLAGETHVPAIVRELTDIQAAQLQAIENVQRKDLDPIEEARGYQHYLLTHGVTQKALAGELGLSESHVSARLKLLEAVPDVRDACAAGEIDGEVALLIARLHSPAVQVKALKALKGKYLELSDGGKQSYRRIRDFLTENYTLKLKEALFDPKDAQLLADAGACTTCPKRSGNSLEHRDLVDEPKDKYFHRNTGPDLCTDPECFAEKKAAHLSVEAGKLAAKGKTVIEGAKARQAVGADGHVKGAYVALKDVKAQLAKAGKKAADLPVVVIQNPRDGKTQEALKLEDLKAAGVKVKAPASTNHRANYAEQQKRHEEERQKKVAKAAHETRVNTAVLAAVRLAAAGQPLSTLALQMVTAAAVAGVPWDQRALLAKLHDCKDIAQLKGRIGQMPADRLTTLLLDCALVDNVIVQPHDTSKPEPLLLAARHYGVDVDQVRKDVSDRPADPLTQDLLTEPQDEPEAEEA